MKKNYKLIKFLKSIGQFNTLSKYSETLRKIFDKKCVKSLIHSLKTEKIITDEDIFNEKFEKKDKDEDKEEEDLSNDEGHQKNLLEYTYEDYLQSQKEINEKSKSRNKNIEPWSVSLKSPRIPEIKKSFDSYKYNPKYDIIFKRVPSFSFIKSAKTNNKSDNKKLEKKNRNYSKLNIKTMIDKHIKNKKMNKFINIKTKTNIKEKNKYLPLLTSISFISSKNKTQNQKEKSINLNNNLTNLCFNKSKHSRKPIKTYSAINKNSDNEPFNYFKSQNKIVNYKKMLSRNEKNSIYTYDFKTPSMLLYKPKYDYIEPHSREIIFNPKSFRNTKKYEKMKIMKKIKTSYNISRDYISVDNSKLGKIE